METNKLMQDIYSICKKLDDIKIFYHAVPFNNTEMQMIREIVLVKESGEHIIASSLAKKLGITRSAVSQIVNKLEKNNIIKRFPDPMDKKIAFIELSENAVSVYEETKRRVNVFLEQVVEKLGEEKVENFIKGANEFIDAFEEVVNPNANEGVQKDAAL